ncbi:hypothetical protein ACHAXR_007285 [Thalassiosira sp. AJA248-18]
MGNCINHSPSVAASSQKIDKPAESVTSTDERTLESSSYATISPPASPLAVAAGLTGIKQAEPVTPQHTSLPKSDGNPSVLEQQREEGQRRLRQLVISGANAGDIDWKSIITLAEDLHQKEQQLLRSYNDQRFGSGGNSTRTNISRRQAFFEKRQKRKEIARRRKLESVGSFSVNLLAYDADERCQQKDNQGSVDASSIENGMSSDFEVAHVGSDEIDVFEDDDPSPLYHDTPAYPTLPSRVELEAGRPGTPSPFLESRTVNMSIATEGSFGAATSLFDSAKDESSSSSSSSSDSSTSSMSRGEIWDLITIDENTTVADW